MQLSLFNTYQKENYTVFLLFTKKKKKKCSTSFCLAWSWGTKVVEFTYFLLFINAVIF